MRVRREARHPAFAGRQARRPHHQRPRDLVRGRAGKSQRLRARSCRTLREGARRGARVRFRREPREGGEGAFGGTGPFRRGAPAEALRPAGRSRLGSVVPKRPAPAHLALGGTQAPFARRSARQARRRDRGLLRRPPAFLSTEAQHAHRASCARHLSRGAAGASGRRRARRRDPGFGALHRRAQALSAARSGVRRGQVRRLRVAGGDRRPEGAPRPHEGVLRGNREGRNLEAPGGSPFRARRAHLRDRLGNAPRAHQHDAAEAQAAFPRGRARFRLRLAPHRRHRLPGVALGSARDLSHRSARPHDAHRGHGRPAAGEGSPGREGEHPGRRALPPAPRRIAAARGSGNRTAPGSRWPPTISASATSRTRGSSPSAWGSRPTRGRT